MVVLKSLKFSLAVVAQWIECPPVEPKKVADLIPGQGTCLGCRPAIRVGAYERQAIDVSLLFFLPPFHALSKK